MTDQQGSPSGGPKKKKKKKIIKKKIIKKIVRRKAKTNLTLKSDVGGGSPAHTPSSSGPVMRPRSKAPATSLLKRLRNAPEDGDILPENDSNNNVTLEDVTINDIRSESSSFHESDTLSPPAGDDASTVDDETGSDGLDDFDVLDGMLVDDELSATMIEEEPIDIFDITQDDDDDFFDDDKFAPDDLDYNELEKEDRRMKRRDRVRQIKRRKKSVNAPLLFLLVMAALGAGGYWWYENIYKKKLDAENAAFSKKTDTRLGAVSDQNAPDKIVNKLLKEKEFVEAMDAALKQVRVTYSPRLAKQVWSTFQSKKNRLESADRLESTLKEKTSATITEMRSDWAAILTNWERDPAERGKTADRISTAFFNLEQMIHAPVDLDMTDIEKIEQQLLARVQTAQQNLDALNFDKVITDLGGDGDKWGPLQKKRAELLDRAHAAILRRQLKKLVNENQYARAQKKLDEIRDQGDTGAWVDQTNAWLELQQNMIQLDDLVKSGDFRKAKTVLENATGLMNTILNIAGKCGDKAVNPDLVMADRKRLSDMRRRIETGLERQALAQRIDGFRKKVAAANNAYLNGDYIQAERLYGIAIQARKQINEADIPDDLKKVGLTNKQELSRAFQALADKKWPDAIAAFNTALDSAPIDQRDMLKGQIAEPRRRAMIADLDESIADGDRKQAMIKADALLNENPDDVDVQIKAALAAAIGFDTPVLTDTFGHRYVRIPPGRYTIDGADGPIILLNVLYVAEYEVTGKDIDRFLKAESYPPPPSAGDYADMDRSLALGDIPFALAERYCEWLTRVHQDKGARYSHAVFRLPARDEWSVFAQGEQGLYYPWGTEWDASKVPNRERGDWMPYPPGSFPADKSKYGVYDVSSNLAEWVDSGDSSTMAIRGGSFQGSNVDCKLDNYEVLSRDFEPYVGMRVVIEIDARQYDDPAGFNN